MSRRIRAWLDGRTPPPPADLRSRILEAVGDVEAGEGDDATIVEALLEAGVSSLVRARSRPGRVRETAFELLVADALLTYACEAALESESPDEALASILAAGARA